MSRVCPTGSTIVGGGFAGLYAAKSLGIDPEVRLTLVDRRNFHLFQPLLYQVATGALSPGDIAQPLRSILRKQRNTTVILGEAIGIDPERREVLLADGGPIAYDTLIVATGAHHTYFDHPEWASIAPGLKTLEDATEIRRRILIAFEAAEREADPEPAQGVDDVRARRRRADRGRAGRARSARSPTTRSSATSGRSGRARPGSSWSRRWIGSCRRIRPIGRRRRSASSRSSASRSGRGRGSSTWTRTVSASIGAGRDRGDDPGPDRLLGGGRAHRAVRADRRRGDRGRDRPRPGGSSSSPT